MIATGSLLHTTLTVNGQCWGHKAIGDAVLQKGGYNINSSLSSIYGSNRGSVGGNDIYTWCFPPITGVYMTLHVILSYVYCNSYRRPTLRGSFLVMFLPTLRPPLASEQSPEQLPSPPVTSSPHKPPLRNGPFEYLPAVYIPGHTYDDVLLAQEMAEDDQLQTRATNMWRESQINSCAEDNETTPWLQHTKWPERFQNRPQSWNSTARHPYV